jgi:hypothetical protein
MNIAEVCRVYKNIVAMTFLFNGLVFFVVETMICYYFTFIPVFCFSRLNGLEKQNTDEKGGLQL